MSVNRVEIKNRLGDDIFTKYDAFIGTSDISEAEFAELTLRILKTEASMNINGSSTSDPPKVVSTIKIWAISPLDPTNTCFSKALENERIFKETSDIKIFDLDRTKWVKYRDNLMTKSDRCCLKKVLSFPVSATATTHLDLLKCYSQFPKATVLAHGNSFWDASAITATSTNTERNAINDQRILSNMLGEYLLSSLINPAQNKVKIDVGWSNLY